MKWVWVAIAACALLAVGVAKRDWILRRIQHAPGTRVVLGFSNPVPPAAAERARELVADKLPSTARVEIDGEQIVIELDPDPLNQTFVRDLEALAAHPPHAAVRVLDADPHYARAGDNKLGVTATGGYLTAADDYAHTVTQAWADQHGCHGKHVEYVGVWCHVTGRELLEMFVHGDAELGITPADVPLPPERELAYGKLQRSSWRTYLVSTRELVLEPTMFGGSGFSEHGRDAIAQFGGGGPLALVIDDEVRATLVTPELPPDPELGFVALPATLRVVEKSTY